MNTSKETEDFDPKTLLISLKEVEFLHIIHIMFFFSGNRTKTARALGFSIRTLRNKLNEYQKERNISFPLVDCARMNKAQFRHAFLVRNRLSEEKFDFPNIDVAEETIKTLISDYGFPPYLLESLPSTYLDSSR